MANARTDEWRRRGTYFSWAPADGGADAVDVFHVEMGDPGHPVVLLVHGWPTSSIDWFEVAQKLSTDFRVCALDFPGYGFSDKPRNWGYSLARDEELMEFYLAQILEAKAAVVVAHDRGDSVALLHATRCAEDRSATRLTHLVLSNGNIFLPMSNLTDVQRRILDPATGPEITAALTPENLAQAMGASTMTPPRKSDDPDVMALTVTFAHNDGPKVMHETIQYLVERSQNEEIWLESLTDAPFPVSLIWGLYDTVSPPRVATYVWNHYLMLRRSGGKLYFIPDANHYSQVDRPDAYANVVRHALDPALRAPGPTEFELHSPLLVDSSREQLSPSAGLLRTADPTDG
jgi:pimeloyl-ACP methyl ester carboxylesterase